MQKTKWILLATLLAGTACHAQTTVNRPPLTITDSATSAPWKVTERNAAPTSPQAGHIYLDDGTNTVSALPGFRRYTGSAWEDIGTVFPDPWQDIVAGSPSNANILLGKADMNLDHVYDVRDYGATGDGVTDDTAAIQAATTAAMAAGDVVYFPAGTYLMDSGATVTIDLTADLAWVGGTGAVVYLDDYLVFEADDADTSLTLSGNVSRGGTTITVDDASAVSAGDVLFLYTTVNIGPGQKWELQTVRSISSNTITLDQPLNLSFATTDAGLSIKAYNGRCMSVQGLTFSVDALANIQLKFLNGLSIRDCQFTSRDTTGTISVIASANADVSNMTYSGGWYGCEPTHARNVRFRGVTATVNQHPIAPGYGTVGCWIDGLVSRGAVGSIDSHFAFDVGYENVDGNDTGDFNFRGLGNCYLKNARIHTTAAADNFVFYIGQPTALTADTEIYDETVMVWENVRIETPNIDANDLSDQVVFHYGEDAILRNVDAYYVSFYGVPTYDGFKNVQISDSRLGRLGTGSGQKVAVANTLFTSGVDGNEVADYAINMASFERFTLTNCQIADYNAVFSNYAASLVPVVVSNCHIADCNNLTASGGDTTADLYYFSNTVFEDVNNISTSAVLANAHVSNCRYTGNTEAILEATHTWTGLTALADGDEECNDVTVTGAALGDMVEVSASIDTSDLMLTARVKAANTVRVQYANQTGGPITLASHSIYIRVRKR